MYRIFYYDCAPIDKTVYNPLTQKNFNFAKSPTFIWMNNFLNNLKQRRKVALRMGFFADEEMNYVFSAETVKKLCKKSITIDDIQESNLVLNMRQKGVDMKIGLDIASLAYKKLVDQIVLISGDSDFVPAAKLARIEDIDFIVDSLGMKINDNLTEHIDGLRTYYKVNINSDSDDEESWQKANIFTYLVLSELISRVIFLDGTLESPIFGCEGNRSTKKPPKKF